MSPPPLVLCTWEEEGEEQGTHESPAVDWSLGHFWQSHQSLTFCLRVGVGEMPLQVAGALVIDNVGKCLHQPVGLERPAST